MAKIQRIELTRVFESNGVRLPDPDPAMDVQTAVRLIAMAGRPELMACEIRGPETRGTEQVYTLHRAVGTKGAEKRSIPMMTTNASAHHRRAKALAEIKSLRQTAPAALTKSEAAVLQRLGDNKGANGLVLPSHSVPWLG
jgi:PRTRC genetic system protein C